MPLTQGDACANDAYDRYLPLMAKTERTPEINRAIREIMAEKGLRQVDLTERLPDKSASIIQRWVTGGKDGLGGHGPSLTELPRLEKAMGVDRGEILRRAGYVRDSRTVIEQLRTWESLDINDRELAVEFVLRLVESAKTQRFKASTDAPSKRGGKSIPDAM